MEKIGIECDVILIFNEPELGKMINYSFSLKDGILYDRK